MQRKSLILFCLLLAACAPPQSSYEEASITDLQDLMQRGELGSEELVSWYLERIDAIDRAGPELNSIIELNPDALQIARALDEERKESGPRGPMHGIPVVLKANIDTADRMHTTAGSLALKDHIAKDDAFLVSRLRDAGAIILGKSNLSEWANFRSEHSSSGWSSIGGQTKNPYDLARNPCGSSSGSGVAVAASLTTVAIGTETNGSIVCPAGINGIVGIKPTMGIVSRGGIIPIAHSQDTAGPMARTVRDAAILLGAMTGIDPDDSAAPTIDAIDADYTANLTADGLRGKRIGVIRSYYGSGQIPAVEEIFDASIAVLEAAGAEVIDPINIDTEGMGDSSYEVLLFEFKTDLGAYLEKSGAPIRSLADVISFNDANAETTMPFFAQDILQLSETKGPLSDEAYLAALRTSKQIAIDGLDGAISEHQLDALIAPTNSPAWMTDHVNGDNFSGISSSSYGAVSGYPTITVPAGYISGLPIGISFIGAAYSDKALIEIAYTFEQAADIRHPPEL